MHPQKVELIPKLTLWICRWVSSQPNNEWSRMDDLCTGLPILPWGKVWFGEDGPISTVLFTGWQQKHRTSSCFSWGSGTLYTAWLRTAGQDPSFCTYSNYSHKKQINEYTKSTNKSICIDIHDNTCSPPPRQTVQVGPCFFCHRCWRCGQEILAELEAVEAHEEPWSWDSGPGRFWRVKEFMVIAIILRYTLES